MSHYADRVIINAKVATVDADFSFAEAIAISEGKIMAVGRHDDIQKTIGENTQIIDAQQKVVLPAANDAHIHATHTGMLMSGDFLDLFDCEHKEDFERKLDAYLSAHPDQDWIYGMGCPFELAEESGQKWPVNAAFLSARTQGKLTSLSDFSLHNLIINREVIDKTGSSLHEFPQTAHVGRDAQGHLSGVVSEWGAMNVVGKQLDQLSDEALKKYILLIQRKLLENGITSYTDILGPGGDHLFHGAWSSRIIQLYQALYEEKRLLTRVSVNLFAAKDGIHSFEQILRGIEEFQPPLNRDPSWLKIGTIKLFGDSAPCIRTSCNGYHGALTFAGNSEAEQIAELKKTLMELHRLGWQVGIHAIGGKTIDAAIEAICSAQHAVPNQDLRHFIIHGDDITPHNAQMMAEHGILLSCQPIAGYMMMEGIKQMISDEYNPNLFDWQAYMDAGVVVAAGSDACCFPFNWLKGLEFTLTRKAKNHKTYQPERACHIQDAIRMYTINGAIQEHLEHERGSIEVGKVADLQILSQDIFTLPAEQIGETQVMMTLCNGEVVYVR